MDIKDDEVISIIVPIYKVEPYLRKCIESIINQTYWNLEIILVDDGSPDRCGEICDEYAAKDNRIRVIHKTNCGVSEARNSGLDIAKGKYIGFIDGDDWVHKDFYMFLYGEMKKHNADISVCNYKKVRKEDEILRDSGKQSVYTNIEALSQIYDKRYLQMIVPWNKLYKKELFIDRRYPKGKIHEDEYLLPRILYSAGKIVYTDKQLVYYRQTPNSIMNGEFNINRLYLLEVLYDRMEFYKDKGLINLYSKTIIRITKIISYLYYNVGKSQIKDKVKIFKDLNISAKKIKSIKLVKLPLKDRIKYIMFRISLSAYLIYYSVLMSKDKSQNKKFLVDVKNTLSGRH